MTTHTTPGATPPVPGARTDWWRGRSEIFVGLLTIGIGAFVGVQTLSMRVPDNTSSPGPQFFPTLVTVLMLVAGIALIVQVVRRPATPDTDGPRSAEELAQEQTGAVGAIIDGHHEESRPHATHSDWATIGIVLGTLVLFTLALQPVGWLLSGAVLFFGVTYAFGGRRILFDATLALVFSSVIQLAFVAGLGLNLPAGILGGIL
ncbi:tripartite tricarboxylate transporter TctB family protein [Nocardiopsis ansamitocini]|uniref:DUF1468 domain-containing protein n=1 Tax=Nocardiopsis ansamitocini TaxID=1670832 RepID=A0A9W6UJ92_9ACTN|nr:tripartite tricarboxylate transporter TctB family protein [Nocardiopsis ansamitocini]GLU48497.1 hypothetical protein Nans01_28480 [Nocardiopsis ansamitocini]